MDLLPIRRAVLSVTDKTDLVEFAQFLKSGGVSLVSTGGTRKKLAEAGLEVTGVSAVTGFPEIMGGRVKTLHPHVHAGILADKDNPEHLETLAGLGVAPFDLVCVNLYDFAEAAKKSLPLKAAVEEIDVGGPTMLRASAKNYHSVLVVPDPRDYPAVMEELSTKRFHCGLELRKRLAVKTFETTSRYDGLIAAYLAGREY